MNAPRLSQAEETAAILLQAERSGAPVLIPGAFERRVSGPAAPRQCSDLPATDHADTAAVSDRARLEHELEGGGAPSEPAARQSGTIGARLWQSVLHPKHVPDIWRRRLPQAR
jgi:hypothetical protein